jgi:hypothetical protein
LGNNVYSVQSRLIGEIVEARIFAERVEVWYAQRRIETMPRLRGEGKHLIRYRHIIDWLVRKPGAFENYRYREDLFPTSLYRMAYDTLKRTRPTRGHKEYLEILYLAAHESEAGVNEALRVLMDREEVLTAEAVKRVIESKEKASPIEDVAIEDVDLGIYDELLAGEEVACG